MYKSSVMNFREKYISEIQNTTLLIYYFQISLHCEMRHMPSVKKNKNINQTKLNICKVKEVKLKTTVLGHISPTLQ